MKIYLFLIQIQVVVMLVHGQADVSGRIYNGKNAQSGLFPFQSLQIHVRGNSEQFCGGSLISRRHILTAAHCTYNTDFSRVYLGIVDTENLYEESYQTVDSYNNFVHPYYDASVNFLNDIAILMLPAAVNLNDEIQMIQLPRSVWAPASTFDSYPVTASGWGRTHDYENSMHESLQYGTMYKMPQKQCETFYSTMSLTITEGMICTDKSINSVGPCQGDSGGPLTVNLISGKYLIGAVSWTVGNCSSGSPIVFVNVAHYLPWISEITGIPF